MNGPIRIRPRLHRPMISCRDRLVLLAPWLLVVGGLLFASATDRWVFGSLSVLVGSGVSVLFWTRHVGTHERRAGLLFALPILLGIALSVHPAVDSIPILVGAVLSSALIVWYRTLRHPPEFRSAVRQYRTGNMARTRESLGPSIERNPTHWQSYQLRAVVNLWLFEIVAAEQDARAALRLAPNHHMCHSTLGHALIAQGQYAEAKAVFSQALELAPGYAIHHYSKGLACFRLQEFQQAAELFRTAARGKLPFVEQRLFASYYLGHSLLHAGQSTEAQSALRSMKRFRQGYERTLARYRGAPDFPGVIQLRKELQEIKELLDRSAT